MKSSNNSRTKKRTIRTALFALAVLFLLSVVSVIPANRVFGHGGQELQSANPIQRSQQSPDGIWKEADIRLMSARDAQASPRAFRTLDLSRETLKELLGNAPMEFSDAALTSGVLLTLPMPDGTFGRFQIEESPVMEPELAAQFPEIKSYRAQGVDDPTATARFDWTPFGFHALVLSTNGSVFIEPYNQNDSEHYISYYKDDLQDGFFPPQCEVSEIGGSSTELRRGLSGRLGLEGITPAVSVGTSLRTYRLALATTVEYTNNSTYGGGKSATLTKLGTIVNLINAIFEREVSIRFQLVAGELDIIFDTTDAYTNGDGMTMLGQNAAVINGTPSIGASGYDIGHVFGLLGAGSSSGIASVGVVCGSSTNKGRGASNLGIALVTGNFSIDSGLVAHEWGHQFSALHSFNSTVGSICGGQRSASSAWEPGSGSTLMSYAGNCATQSPAVSENLQNLPDNYFHAGSFEQIANYAASSGTCATSTSTGNTAPTVSAGADFTIPMGTPFTLTATGSDPNGDALTFSWEELDLGNASPPMTDDGTRPLFRSFPAVTSPSRTFPRLSNLLNNTTNIGESLPTTTRAMNFRVTARDNRAAGGGVNSDSMVLTVTSTAGPFQVTAPNTAVSWTGGTTQTVTWNVANTSAAPVSCANVKISLSTDGGNTFPTVILASTPNDGTQSITVPNISTSSARIKVEAVGNVFFDLSNANFTVVPGAATAYQGFMDAAGCGIISGWAWDANQPNAIINVDILDGSTIIASVPANLYREDIRNAGIGDGFHGFSFTTPASLKNGVVHTIRTRFGGTATDLTMSPRTINCSGVAPNYQGFHDGAGCNTISGWAWDANDPNNPINVDLYDGATFLTTVPAIQYRPDLVTAGIGNGFHGFSLTVPASLKNGATHSIRVRFPGTSTDLQRTPRSITCSGAAPVYEGVFEVADCNTISGWAWDQNDPNSPINVAIFDGSQLIATVLAIQFRQSLVDQGKGNGFHVFIFNTPASLKNGQPHSINVRFSGSATGLTSSPRSITCP